MSAHRIHAQGNWFQKTYLERLLQKTYLERLLEEAKMFQYLIQYLDYKHKKIIGNILSNYYISLAIDYEKHGDKKNAVKRLSQQWIFKSISSVQNFAHTANIYSDSLHNNEKN